MSKHNCEHGGDHEATDGMRFCSDACKECEHADFDAEVTGCAGICGLESDKPPSAPPPAEPRGAGAGTQVQDPPKSGRLML
jgi:hypothetical protein